jgi:ribosomal protein S18 acetylase RimI-like enzyme
MVLPPKLSEVDAVSLSRPKRCRKAGDGAVERAFKPSACEIVLREATEADASLIAALIRAAFAEYAGVLDPPSSAHAESADSVLRKMQTASGVVAFQQAEPAGCVLYEARRDHFYFFRLAVLPAFRRRGLGKMLVDHVESIAGNKGFKEIRLGVRLAMTKQRAYYERLGYRFREAGTHPGHMEPTFAILAKDLGGPGNQIES